MKNNYLFGLGAKLATPYLASRLINNALNSYFGIIVDLNLTYLMTSCLTGKCPDLLGQCVRSVFDEHEPNTTSALKAGRNTSVVNLLFYH